MRSEIFEDIVIQLHQIARCIEIDLGAGNLANDIRQCADRLHEVINKGNESYDPVI